ncbi:MAG TPA: hypothetical protein VHB98_04760 [Chloroflexota bacterium]|nr:hypothetical protein [Chloroflexota bacterium]
MGTAPGDVAKALLDSLPNLDHKKLLEEARRPFGIVLIGEEQATTDLLHLLREHGTVPSDSKVAIWRHVPEANAPMPVGKTELAIVVPATEDYLKQARESFGGVAVLPIVLGEGTVPPEVSAPVHMAALDEAQVRKVLVPRLVDRLWERRLALGRALPATRDRIVWLLMQRAVRDVKVLLGSVAGAGSGRSGVPTPATAQLLIHQASLIVAIGTVYGAEIEDKRALITRVTPNLTPTLVLDVAESQATRIAEGLAGEKYKKIYGTAAAVITRPTLSASSTLLAGMAARRVFRERPAEPSAFVRAAARTRDMGRRAAGGIGQGAAVVVGGLTARLRRADDAPVPDAEGSAAGESGGESPEREPYEIEQTPEDRAG